MPKTMSLTSRPKVLLCLGTRPELIKVAPLVHEFARTGIQTTLLHTGQHADLLEPLFELFEIRPHHNLGVMLQGQTLNGLSARILERIDPILEQEQPDFVLVQGDTASALCGAQAAFNRRIPVGHIEAGLRSGNPLSPFPEEMNRRLVTQLSSLHFAATTANRDTLLAEGVAAASIHVTGNPVVDALHSTLAKTKPSDGLEAMRNRIDGRKIVVVTTHRRENFGSTMRAHLRALRRFAEAHPGVCVVFPVHPNPKVREAVAAELMGCDSVIMVPPMGYADFSHLLSWSWMIASDSGGIQEEAAALGKPILVLRENTERPEGVAAGVARLVGDRHDQLEQLLNQAVADHAWFTTAGQARDVFGDGRAARRIARILLKERRARLAA